MPRVFGADKGLEGHACFRKFVALAVINKIIQKNLISHYYLQGLALFENCTEEKMAF